MRSGKAARGSDPNQIAARYLFGGGLVTPLYRFIDFGQLIMRVTPYDLGDHAFLFVPVKFVVPTRLHDLIKC